MFSSPIVLPLLLLLSCSLLAIPASCDFYKDIQITWGNDHAKILDSGKQLQLSLDKTCGSGFQSMKEYLYGKIDMQLKLVPGNSAGTVTTYYLSSQGSAHDEIDFEFLGNVTGEPYILHTNIYCQGKGNREQQFYLWFDPTQAFHNYTIVWNPQNIIFLVDGIPIRDFKNEESLGVPFPKNQAMRVYGSLWNATWATRGGLVQTNWSNAPFTASYANFNDNNACVWLGSDSSCNSKFPTSASSSNNAWLAQELDGYRRRRMKWVQRKFMIYNYCNDKKRFPQGMPPECAFH